MKNSEFISQLATLSNMNKTQTILTLFGAGYDFQKELNEQVVEVDEKVSQMLLKTLVTPVNQVIEVDVEVIQDETQAPHQEEPQVEVIIDERELQLMELFNAKRTQPAKIKDKPQLVELILNILIPRSCKNTLKGRIQKDVHKRKYITQLINNSNSKEQLSTDLINWIDEFKHKASKLI